MRQIGIHGCRTRQRTRSRSSCRVDLNSEGSTGGPVPTRVGEYVFAAVIMQVFTSDRRLTARKAHLVVDSGRIVDVKATMTEWVPQPPALNNF